MARESSDSLSFLPAVLWNLTTPELEALFMVAEAEAVTPTAGPLPDTPVSFDSVRLSCIWVLAADRRVDVSTCEETKPGTTRARVFDGHKTRTTQGDVRPRVDSKAYRDIHLLGRPLWRGLGRALLPHSSATGGHVTPETLNAHAADWGS